MLGSGADDKTPSTRRHPKGEEAARAGSRRPQAKRAQTHEAEQGSAKRLRADAARLLRRRMLQVWDAMVHLTAPAGGGQRRQRAELYMELPDRSELPEYFDVVKKPMELNRIRAKIETDAYADLDAFSMDTRLMINNAKLFNMPDSTVYKDAVALGKVFEKQ